jgi:hypothetical protein
MRRADQGVVKDEKGQEQPADKQRAQTVHRTDPKRSVSREATRDPKLRDGSKTPRSGMPLMREGTRRQDSASLIRRNYQLRHPLHDRIV